MKEKEVNILLIGAKSIGQYGGYESFVNKLLEYHKDKKNLHYYVYCKANGSGCMDITKLPGAKAISDREFCYYNARGFLIHVPQIGAAQAIYYDVKALSEACKLIKNGHLKNPVIYIMACRIGPFMSYFTRKIHKLGGKVYLNPGGWKDIIWLNQKTPHKYSVLTA